MTAFFLTIFSTMLSASPHPLTGSSIINQPDNSMAFSQMGFKLSSVPSYWVFNKSLESTSNLIEMGLPNRTLLSFRLENVSPKTILEQYVRRYLKDYNQYGFELAGLQSLPSGHVPSVIVDLNQKNKSTRSRQVFFVKQGKLIIATCSDDASRFDSTVAVCNQILGGFDWR